MALRDVVEKIQYHKKDSLRYRKLNAYRRVLDGTIFDHLRWPFHKEENGTEYIPIIERRPSVYYNIFRLLVDQTSSLTFGEAHAPSIRVNLDPDEDPKKSAALHTSLELLSEHLHLPALMIKAMNLGSPGSVLLIIRQLPDKSPFIEFIEGDYCKPFFDVEDPRVLDHVDIITRNTAEDIELAGYSGKYEEDKIYFLKVTYSKEGKLASLPMEQKRYERIGEMDEQNKEIRWIPDEERSWPNPFDEIPCIWVKNLDLVQGVDGAPTVNEKVIDMSFEISYGLSQSGRGYRYTADPILMVKDGGMRTALPLGGMDDPSMDEIRSPARTMRIGGDGGDAKMLEISANGLKAYDEHCAVLREYALELASGMKSESKDTGGMQSGKALEMLHASLVWLVEKFRTSYGEMCYLILVQRIVKAIVKGQLSVPDVDTSPLKADLLLRLAWPEWSTPTGADMQAEMEALATGVGSTQALPVPFITVEMAGQKAASILGFGDQNRAAAQVMQHHEENPPLTAREAHEGDMEIQKEKMKNDHELNKQKTAADIEHKRMITEGKVKDNTHIAKAKAASVRTGDK